MCSFFFIKCQLQNKKIFPILNAFIVFKITKTLWSSGVALQQIKSITFCFNIKLSKRSHRIFLLANKHIKFKAFFFSKRKQKINNIQ